MGHGDQFVSESRKSKKRALVVRRVVVSIVVLVAFGGAYLLATRHDDRSDAGSPSELCVPLVTSIAVPDDAGAAGAMWNPEAAFSPDGKTLAISGKPVQLWDTASGALVKTIDHAFGMVDVLAFSPDGKVLAMAGRTTTVRDYLGFEPTAPSARGKGGYFPVLLWSLERSQEQELLLHEDAIGGVAFASDGQAIATMPRLGDAVILWNAAKTRTATPLQGYAPHVGGLAFSPDGKTLAVATSLGEVRLLDRSTHTVVRTFEKTGQRHVGMTFSPDGTNLAILNSGEPIQIWNVATGQPVSRIAAGDLVDYHYVDGGRTLVTVDHLNKVQTWDPATGKPVGSERQLCSPHRSEGGSYLGFNPAGTVFAEAEGTSAGAKKEVVLYSMVS